ncbi:hypothetical protein ACFSM5_06160 [Lacibacterium aquatile]|uniref:Uncharacterized protein n=1 Tax=Lacibacterium aquatile TaxID=1168082 RepID=A0ABW5DPN8_9PROT
MRFTGLVPMLQTLDVSGTRRWYEDVLAIMFMRNAHLGDPHATATQYIYA